MTEPAILILAAVGVLMLKHTAADFFLQTPPPTSSATKAGMALRAVYTMPAFMSP